MPRPANEPHPDAGPTRPRVTWSWIIHIDDSSMLASTRAPTPVAARCTSAEVMATTAVMPASGTAITASGSGGSSPSWPSMVSAPDTPR